MIKINTLNYTVTIQIMNIILLKTFVDCIITTDPVVQNCCPCCA